MKYDKDGNVKCRVCGCTDREPCNPPCAWFRGSDLCTTCAEALKHFGAWRAILKAWREVSHHANLAALTREAERLEAITTATKNNEQTAQRAAARRRSKTN
ncbi:MAG: hypothetical protein IPK75_20455 [Acidobacteria bacterium]|nr:hypothetical protein [Acidobacteriota bacterium]